MKNIVSCSFGKDSLAQIIVMRQMGIAIDDVIYCDIHFDKTISGEHPLMAEWIPVAEKILKSKFGITVTHISSEKTFLDYFYTEKQKGNHKGDIYGFPYIIGAWCNSRLKINVINKYLSNFQEQITQYVGIAYDEPNRYYKLLLRNKSKVKNRSVLYEQKIKEIEAFNICEKYDLISPHYSLGGFRGGCWFCVKQSHADLYDLWVYYPKLFYRLLELEKESFNSFLSNTTLCEMNKRFESGYVPRRKHKNRELSSAA